MGIQPGFVIFVTAFAIGPIFLPSSASATARTVVVVMRDLPPGFVPRTLKIARNTTVERKNTGNELHGVSTVLNDAQIKNDVHLPPGAKPFHSGFIQPGKTWKHRFSVTGHYTYFCLAHEKDGMVGKIDVSR
jgi:plastocyanin